MSPKIRIAVAATAALALAMPAAAAARHGHGHGQSRAGGRTQSTVRGTVASLQSATLTITRTDGTTVSARVTAGTEIECQTAAMPTATTAERHGGGDQTSGGDQARGRDDAVPETETEAAEAPENEATEPAGQDQGDAAGSSGAASTAARCDASALTTGATVSRARIRSTASGPVFKQIELAA
jgi:hypothetical protein